MPDAEPLKFQALRDAHQRRLDGFRPAFRRPREPLLTRGALARASARPRGREASPAH
jgi:hypothetical protein